MSACTSPLTDDALLAWWADELPPAEQEQLEEHLLSCDECSRRGHTLGMLAEGVRGLAGKGALSAVVLPAVLECWQNAGRRVREYHVRPGGGVQCTVGPEDDVVLARLRVDFGDVGRLDLVIRVDGGPEERLADIPFDPAADELLFAPSAAALRAMPAHVQRMRLLAVEEEGERLLGEYTFHHTPWPGR